MKQLPYRILAIDMDGTTLNSHNTLSSRNRNALIRAIGAGVFVVPATGRLYSGLPPELEEVPGIRYYLCSNGAVVYDKADCRVLHQILMPPETAVWALRVITAHGGMVDVYLNGRAYTSRKRYAHPLQYGVQPDHVETFRRSRTPVADLADFLEKQKEPVEKLFSIFQNMQARSRCWDILTADNRLAVTTSFETVIEVTDREATKGGGLRALAAHLQVPQTEVMAVGDGHNDLSMLEWAGLGVAMGNAAALVRSRADVITGNCDDDGLAQAIDRWIFQTNV